MGSLPSYARLDSFQAAPVLSVRGAPQLSMSLWMWGPDPAVPATPQNSITQALTLEMGLRQYTHDKTKDSGSDQSDRSCVWSQLDPCEQRSEGRCPVW